MTTGTPKCQRCGSRGWEVCRTKSGALADKPHKDRITPSDVPDRVIIKKTSRIVAERWYYDPTYLLGPGKDDASLFVRHFALVETKSGKRSVRVVFNVEFYANSDLMVSAIKDRGMSEVPQEFCDDRSWEPPELKGCYR